MVKVVEKTIVEKYVDKRIDDLEKITSEILSGEEVYYNSSFYRFVVGDVRRGQFKAIVNTHNRLNRFGGRIIVMDKSFYPIVKKLADSYEESIKKTLSNFNFLERLRLPAKEEGWIIKKDY